MKRYLILAGNFAQAEDWRESKNLSKLECTYIQNPTTILGYRASEDVELVRTGTYWQRKDLEEILARLEEQGFNG